MKSLLTALTDPWWRFWALLVRRMRPDEKKPCFVVLGFPRSGTSLVSRLLAGAGISFGDQGKWKRSDWRNPKGFYEYADAIRLDEKLARQSGFVSPYMMGETAGLRAQGTLNRLRRLFSRIRMMRILRDISGSTEGAWAIKQFPTTFYFWEPYLTHGKIVAVYRDPLENAYSVHKSFRRATFRQALRQWTESNKELLYHVTTKPSMLIKLEDLTDSQTRTHVLNTLVAFLGQGSVAELSKMVEPFTAESKMYIERLREYPLDQDTRDVYDALERLKVS